MHATHNDAIVAAMSDLSEIEQHEEFLRELADKWAANPVQAARLESAADEIDRLTSALKDMAYMAANRAPKPGDTHVETFLPVALWREFRP